MGMGNKWHQNEIEWSKSDYHVMDTKRRSKKQESDLSPFASPPVCVALTIPSPAKIWLQLKSVKHMNHREYKQQWQNYQNSCFQAKVGQEFLNYFKNHIRLVNNILVVLHLHIFQRLLKLGLPTIIRGRLNVGNLDCWNRWCKLP